MSETQILDIPHVEYWLKDQNLKLVRKETNKEFRRGAYLISG